MPLRKIVKNLIEHPILYSEVFIYVHITAYCLNIFYKIQVVSNLDRRLKGVYVPCLQCYVRAENSLWFPSVCVYCIPTFRIKQYCVSDKNQINSCFLSKRRNLKQSTQIKRKERRLMLIRRTQKLRNKSLQS